MRICFIHDWSPDLLQEMTWQDGLAAALKELQSRGHEIMFITCGEREILLEHPYFDIRVTPNIPYWVKQHAPEVILHWADFTRPHAKLLAGLGIPMAICFAGGEALGENIDFFDHIFVESEVYKNKLKDAGYENVSTAFGTNTDLFEPIPEQPKLYDTIFPATFATWKRHELYAQAVDGLRSLACGYMYHDHEQECWQECLKRGAQILPHIPAEALQYLYAASKVCVIPSRSDGGSQRTILEAMAMNIPVVVCDSDKFDFAKGRVFEAEPTPESIRGFVDALLDGEQTTSTRDYILKNWSHTQYADGLEKGLKAIL